VVLRDDQPEAVRKALIGERHGRDRHARRLLGRTGV
jgi:hypothetical protein